MFRKNLLANYVGHFWVALMGLAFVPLYIRYLGMEAYGLIGFFVALQAWMNVLDFGMGPTLNRELARRMHDPLQTQSSLNLLRSIECVSFGAAALATILLILSANYLADNWFQGHLLSADAIYFSVVVMGSVIAIRLIEGVYRNALLGLQQHWSYNVQRIAYATLTPLGAVLVLEYWGAKVEYFFVWQLVAISVSVLVMRYLAYSRLTLDNLRPRFELTELKIVFRFASGMFGITLITLMLTQLDKLVLSRLLSLEAFGYYALAASLSAALVSLVSPVEQAIFPRLSSLHGQHQMDDLAAVYHKGTQLVSVVLGSFAIALVFFADEILLLWTQDQLVAFNTAEILQVLAIGTLLNGLMWIPYKLQLASGWTSLAFRMNIAMVLLLVPLMLYIVPIYGGVGAAYVWCLLNLGYVMVTIPIMHRRLLSNHMIAWYTQDVLLPLLAIGGVCLLFRSLVDFPQHIISGLLFLVLLVFLSMSFGLLSSSHLRDEVFSRIQKKVK